MSSTTISDIKGYFYKGNFEACINLIKILADEEGSAAAADVYGDLLMSGFWDTRKMEVDLAKNQLLPDDLLAHPEARPYLILARDPLKAIKYYNKAAYLSDKPENTPVKLRSTAKIEYCKAKGLAGYKESNIIVPEIEYTIAHFLDTSAKNYNTKCNDLESTNFVPMPNIRPHVQNPLTKIFRHVGKKFSYRCIIQIALAQTIASFAYFYSYWSNAIILFLCVFFSISLPLGIFASIGYFQGYRNGLPICCCTKISNAYELSVKPLPADCKPVNSPFKTTPTYIKYTQTIKAIYFWIYILITVFRVLQIFINFKGSLYWLNKLTNSDPKGVLFFTVPINFLLISLCIVFWDKNFSLSNINNVFGEHEGSSALIYLLITMLVSILAHDEDCKRETERLKEKSHLQLLIESL